MNVDPFVVGLGIVNIDIIYSGTPRWPSEGEEVFSSGFDIQLGGGQAATLINLRRLGVPVRLGTYLGSDQLSEFAGGQLSAAGLPFVNLYAGPGSPLTVTSIVSTARDRTFVSYRPPAAEFELGEAEVYELYRGCSVAYISLGYDEVWKRLKREGAVIVLDSAWRDDLSMDLYEEAFGYVDYFTPNDKEAAAITGLADPYEAIAALGDRLRSPIVKLGSEGCLYSEGGVITRVPAAARFPRVDATGAGDAFLSGLIYGIVKGRCVGDAVRMGVLTGGKCVSGIGCLSEYLDEAALLREFGV
jgi:ribokinase